MAKSRTIDYTLYGYEELRDQLVSDIREQDTFKDINIEGSNIRTLIDEQAYIGSLFGYYINAAANEVFLSTSKRYNNLNKIAQMLNYSPRGVVSSTVKVVGSLSPEYVYGKEGQYIEIPSYSIFPSLKPTKGGENFIFTNPNSVVHIVKGFGIRPLAEQDFTYKGHSLPIVANKSLFVEDINGNPTIDITKLEIPLNFYKNLTVVQRNDIGKLRPYDRENFPVYNPLVDSPDVNKQPFNKSIIGEQYISGTSVGIEYPILLTYDIGTSTPYLQVVTDNPTLQDRVDDIIGNLILEVIDPVTETYRLSLKSLTTYQRFYIGKTGMHNIESIKFDYDKAPSGIIERLKLIVNEDGNSPTFISLINGKYYSFTKGVIYSQKFKEDYFDKSVAYYNVNLCINNVNTPENNYGATLEVTTKDPTSNQITIARIYTKVIDIESGTKTIATSPGKNYGNLQSVEKSTYKTSDQKAGRVYFSATDQVHRVIFNTIFTSDDNEESVQYNVQLSSDGNIRKWVSNKTDTGFDIYVEPDAQFTGYISWVATKIILVNTKKIPVIFDSPLNLGVSIDGNVSNYMVQLTPNKNVEVWYENVTNKGFDIVTEQDFEGNVSWSVYNFYDENSLTSDSKSIYRQTGKIEMDMESFEEIVQFEIPLKNNNYAIQLVPNANVNVFYSDKSTNGFTIRKEPGIDKSIIVEWYVDSSENYTFQRHGEVSFSGRSVISGQIPGLYLENIPETFEIDDLYQGQVGFTYIDSNNVVDPLNNFLDITLDSVRINENALKFTIENRKISTNGIRVFVKDESDIWTEWEKYHTGGNVLLDTGNPVYMVKVNPDKKTVIEFGDGINWGISVVGKEIMILGLSSVGSEGNIGKNTLSSNVTVSQYILGNNRTDIQFEKSLVSLIGLKTKLIFEGNSPSTTILDSENSKIDNNSLNIIQNNLSIGGADVESVDELRTNASNSFVRQYRNVSIDDYERYMKEVFYNYFDKVKVLTYEQFKQSGLITSEELSKYWTNYVFIVGLNKDGTNTISKNLRDTVVDNLNSSRFKVIGIEHEIFPAKWVPIDILIRYKKNKYSNYMVIETEMRKNIVEYFQPQNHELGERINHSDLLNLVKVEGVDSIEIMLNKDPDNKFNASDYNPNIVTEGLTEEQQRRNKLLTLVGKDPSLVKIFQPLLDTINNNGTKNWGYTLDVSLSDFEFPKLGDIIIERE